MDWVFPCVGFVRHKIILNALLHRVGVGWFCAVGVLFGSHHDGGVLGVRVGAGLERGGRLWKRRHGRALVRGGAVSHAAANSAGTSSGRRVCPSAAVVLEPIQDLLAWAEGNAKLAQLLLRQQFQGPEIDLRKPLREQYSTIAGNRLSYRGTCSRLKMCTMDIGVVMSMSSVCRNCSSSGSRIGAWSPSYAE